MLVSLLSSFCNVKAIFDTNDVLTQLNAKRIMDGIPDLLHRQKGSSLRAPFTRAQEVISHSHPDAQDLLKLTEADKFACVRVPATPPNCLA